MKVSSLATVLVVVTSLAAGRALAQVSPTSVIRQPGAFAPVVSQPSATQNIVQQPASFTGSAVAPPVSTRAFQQPTSHDPTAAAAEAIPGSVTPMAPGPEAVPATAVDSATLQHPSFYAATNAPPVAVGPVRQVIEQPVAYAPIGAAPPAGPGVALPESINPPVSAFANYYDEGEGIEEEEEDYRPGDEGHDEEDDDLNLDDEDCDRSNTCCGFELGGWIEQGFTFNPYDPQDGYNGTVVLNDLANQWQMNQLWFYADRQVDNGGCGWDWGGRFDVLFGTDAELFQMLDGLEESWDQNGQYQVALLRFYYDLAYNDWTLRVGRFDSPVGYEPFDATESFFYSRSYSFYAEPSSLLGILLTRHLTDQLSVSAGLHRGDAQFDDTDGKNAVDFVGGFSWQSSDEETWLDAYLEAEEQGIGNDTLDYSIVGGTMLTEDIEYVCEWYWGQNDDANQQAEWYGLNQHFMKEINDCWSHGFRFEWFRDDDGFIITDFVRGNTAQGPFDGNFFEFTYAINYSPCENFVLRPEVRWDWYDASTSGPLPFDDGTESDQFLLSIDAIYAF